MEYHFHFYFSFFVYLWHWKTDLNFVFRFSFSPHFEKGIWISVFVFRFLITSKNGFEFRFSCFVFASLWKTDLNFVFRICIADWSFVCHFCMNLKSGLIPVIWNSAPLPLRGWGSVWFSSIRFDSKLKIENQKFTIVIFNVWFLKNWKSQIYNLNCQFLLLRNIKLENNFQCFENQKLKIENGQLVVFISCF